MPICGFMTAAAPVESPLWSLIPSIAAKTSLTHSFLSRVVTRSAACDSLKEGSGFNSIRLWKLVDRGWYSSFTSSLLRKGKEKTKHRKKELSLSACPPASLPPLSHLSLCHSVCGNSCLFSCPSLTKYVNEQMDSSLFALFSVPLRWLTELR